MGGPLCADLSEICIQQYKTKNIINCNIYGTCIQIYFRYDDDTHILFNCSNSINKHILFTFETQTNNKLNF